MLFSTIYSVKKIKCVTHKCAPCTCYCQKPYLLYYDMCIVVQKKNTHTHFGASIHAFTHSSFENPFAFTKFVLNQHRM